MSKIQSKSQNFPYKLIFILYFWYSCFCFFYFLENILSLILEDLFEYLENILTQFFFFVTSYLLKVVISSVKVHTSIKSSQVSIIKDDWKVGKKVLKTHMAKMLLFNPKRRRRAKLGSEDISQNASSIITKKLSMKINVYNYTYTCAL